jgi:transposase InsO family protein
LREEPRGVVDRQRRHRKLLLGPDVEAASASGEDARVQPGDDGRGRREQLLEVVEHEQGSFAAQELVEVVRAADHLRDRRLDQSRVTQGGERDEPHLAPAATHQRQGRSTRQDAAARMGIPLRLPKQRSPSQSTPRLPPLVQPPPTPRLARPTATNQPRLTGLWDPHLAGCTTNPTGAWLAQQARKLGLDFAEQGVRFLIRDRDSKHSDPFDQVVGSEGIRVVKTPVRAPKANASAERFVRTVRAECLDWLLILNRRHLERLLRVYVDHYTRERPHRALELRPPEPDERRDRQLVSEIHRHDRLGGLIHEYYRAAA